MVRACSSAILAGQKRNGLVSSFQIPLETGQNPVWAGRIEDCLLAFVVKVKADHALVFRFAPGSCCCDVKGDWVFHVLKAHKRPPFFRVVFCLVGRMGDFPVLSFEICPLPVFATLLSTTFPSRRICGSK